MSIDINNGNTATPAELEAEIADLRATADGLRADYLSALRAQGSLQNKLDDFTKSVIDTIIYFVDDREEIKKSVALDLFERWGLGLPVVTQNLRVKVTASTDVEVEIDVDEDDVSDKIEEGVEEEIDSDWTVERQYVNLPTVMAKITIEQATRELDLEIELEWGASEEDRTDMIRDAIEDEINGGTGSYWEIETFKVI